MNVPNQAPCYDSGPFGKRPTLTVVIRRAPSALHRPPQAKNLV
jgi:hypothetical protein